MAENGRNNFNRILYFHCPIHSNRDRWERVNYADHERPAVVEVSGTLDSDDDSSLDALHIDMDQTVEFVYTDPVVINRANFPISVLENIVSRSMGYGNYNGRTWRQRSLSESALNGSIFDAHRNPGPMRDWRADAHQLCSEFALDISHRRVLHVRSESAPGGRQTYITIVGTRFEAGSPSQLERELFDRSIGTTGLTLHEAVRLAVKNENENLVEPVAIRYVPYTPRLLLRRSPGPGTALPVLETIEGLRLERFVNDFEVDADDPAVDDYRDDETLHAVSNDGSVIDVGAQSFFNNAVVMDYQPLNETMIRNMTQSIRRYLRSRPLNRIPSGPVFITSELEPEQEYQDPEYFTYQIPFTGEPTKLRIRLADMRELVNRGKYGGLTPEDRSYGRPTVVGTLQFENDVHVRTESYRFYAWPIHNAGVNHFPGNVLSPDQPRYTNQSERVNRENDIFSWEDRDEADDGAGLWPADVQADRLARIDRSEWSMLGQSFSAQRFSELEANSVDETTTGLVEETEDSNKDTMTKKRRINS